MKENNIEYILCLVLLILILDEILMYLTKSKFMKTMIF